jgi:hypothetical protein
VRTPMSRLRRRYLLASVSHVSIVRAWGAQAWAERNQGASPSTAATATPSLAAHDEPKASQPPPPPGGSS